MSFNPSLSDAAREPGGEVLGEARCPHLRLRLLDRIRNSPEGCPSRLVVNQQPCGARVAVARLPDRAGVEQPAGAGGVELGAAAGETAVEPSRRPSESASARWLCPTSTIGAVVASRFSSATSSLSTYSQTGSRALPW